MPFGGFARQRASEKADRTKEESQAIQDQEKAERLRKTERLREQRIAREAASPDVVTPPKTGSQ